MIVHKNTIETFLFLIPLYITTPRDKLISKSKNRSNQTKKQTHKIKKPLTNNEPINILKYINIHNPTKLLRKPIQAFTNLITKHWSEH
jgi:hypothetical protein